MSELPFTLTPEAAANIERLLLDAQREPRLLALATCISFSTSSTWTYKGGGSGGGYIGGHINIGWDSLERVANNEYVELDLVGFKVFAHRTTLERISGKRIELKKGRGMAGTDILAVMEMP